VQRKFAMSTSALGAAIRHLRRALLGRSETGHTDAKLLDAFIERRDEFAFETLMLRHGPMVMGVCRRVLRNDADADDAFQATFLVLVRKGASIRPRNNVGNWLHGVARRTALTARAMSIKRSAKERAAMRPNLERAETCETLNEVIDEELQALSEKYRAVVILCDFEGRSIKDAARQIGCPPGTVGTRLSRGRALLAKRLTRRGVALPASAVAATLAQTTSSAALSSALMSSTLMAATVTAAGRATTAGVITLNVTAITEGVLKAMLIAKLKSATGFILALATAGFAVAWTSAKNEEATPNGKQAQVAAVEPMPAPRFPPIDKTAAIEKELEALQGTWKLMTHEENGKLRNLKPTQLYTFEKDNMTITVGGGVTSQGSIELDPTTSPKRLDFTRTWDHIDATRIDLTIYVRVGDYIIKCGHRDGKTRPTEFATGTKNGGAFLIVLQRQNAAGLPPAGPGPGPGLPGRP